MINVSKKKSNKDDSPILRHYFLIFAVIIIVITSMVFLITMKHPTILEVEESYSLNKSHYIEENLQQALELASREDTEDFILSNYVLDATGLFDQQSYPNRNGSVKILITTPFMAVTGTSHKEISWGQEINVEDKKRMLAGGRFGIRVVYNESFQKLRMKEMFEKKGYTTERNENIINLLTANAWVVFISDSEISEPVEIVPLGAPHCETLSECLNKTYNFNTYWDNWEKVWNKRGTLVFQGLYGNYSLEIDLSKYK